jgi:hypothetical protein
MTDDKLYLADLFANPTDPYIFDDAWDDAESDPPFFWWCRLLTPEETHALTWR